MLQEHGDFEKHAIKFFKLLGWKPAKPDTLSAPHLVVWGNVTPDGRGVYCVIDGKAKLFKLQLNLSSINQKLFTKVVVHYQNDIEAITQFEHYMDAFGGFMRDAWIRAQG